MSSSVTQTTQLKRWGDEPFQGERVYDYLYDPLYTVSSEADHDRSRFKAYVSQARVKKMPQFDSMFSELAHHPGYTLQMDSADHVPTSVDHRWRDQCKEALQQLAGVIPNAQSLEKRDEYSVKGADRWKYFRCPLISSAQQFVFYDMPNDNFVPTVGYNAEPQPTHFTVGVQTDYRESETQTDPYTPEYFIQPGTTPSELLQLATLIWGHGLPAGLAEVEMIQRARAKRAWEATLPPLDDPRQLDKRRRMMEEMEAKEWAFREGEIKKLQEARLAVLRDLLIQRDEAQKQMTNERLNRIYTQHVKDKEAKQQKIQHDFNRSLRKLEAKWHNVAGKLEKPGIARHDNISKKYASWTHKNKLTNSNINRYGLNSFYVDTYEGLLELQEGLAASVLKKPKVKKHKPKVGKVELKPSMDRTEELMKKYKAMTEETTEQVTDKPWSCLVKKEKPVLRPASPRVEEPPEGEEEMELAVIHLQKLLRGRSTQYQMFMGKENHQDLIQELRTTHALQREEQAQQRADKELVISLKKQREQHIHKTSQEEAALDGAVGAELSHLFDTMSKELIRLQEERRIHAFILLAERERRMREAVESGRRQVEEQKRREDDEIFKEVVQVHQESVDLYLEDILLETLEQTADQQAKVEIHQRAQKINDIAYAMEESRDTLQSEEIVSEMMYSFLIPEVEKISVREEVHQRQERHLQAARSIIEETAEHSRSLLSTQEVSESACASGRDCIKVLEEIIPAEQKERRET